MNGNMVIGASLVLIVGMLIGGMLSDQVYAPPLCRQHGYEQFDVWDRYCFTRHGDGSEERSSLRSIIAAMRLEEAIAK